MIKYDLDIKLYHFVCEECEQWWSIGGWGKDGKEMYCPFCGHKAYPVRFEKASIVDSRENNND